MLARGTHAAAHALRLNFAAMGIERKHSAGRPIYPSHAEQSDPSPPRLLGRLGTRVPDRSERNPP